jgi:hypothetical protein
MFGPRVIVQDRAVWQAKVKNFLIVVGFIA